jgi:hypothetical protein
MSHNREITKLVAEAVIDLVKQAGKDLSSEFGTRKAFTDFVFSLSIKMVQDILSCDFATAYDVVMGDGQFDALVSSVYNGLQPA